MATEGFKRKLAAILSADVVGYSRLMGEDEAATMRMLETYKRVIGDLIQQHRGRVVDSPGDNLLAEFASVVDAVQCAVAVQKEIQSHNQELPENRRMQFRIGINLGDVIETEDNIYGDGVNIAARLESLAEPGGICISKTALDHIETKLPLGYEFLGGQNVKNIAKPVPAYKVLMDSRVTVKTPARAKPKEGARRRSIFIALLSVLIMAAAAVVFWRYAFPPAAPPVEKASQQQMGLSPARQAIHRSHALPEPGRGAKPGFFLRWVN
jgi:adenylate cyclase